jgi:hypothetical protein
LKGGDKIMKRLFAFCFLTWCALSASICSADSGIEYLRSALSPAVADASYMQYSTAFNTASNISGLGTGIASVLVLLVGLVVLYTAYLYIKRAVCGR